MSKGERISQFVRELEGGEVDPSGDVATHPFYRGFFRCWNEQRYYEAHDVLEQLWLNSDTEDDNFFKGLIQAAAMSAVFILVNSIGGLVGYFTAVRSLPVLGVYLAIPAIIGGTIGSHLGSRRFPARAISILLAIVLAIAGTKLIFTR